MKKVINEYGPEVTCPVCDSCNIRLDSQGNETGYCCFGGPYVGFQTINSGEGDSDGPSADNRTAE